MLVQHSFDIRFVSLMEKLRKKFGESMFELEVEALPANLPHSLTVDLSVLDELHKSIYVKDIVVPKLPSERITPMLARWLSLLPPA